MTGTLIPSSQCLQDCFGSTLTDKAGTCNRIEIMDQTSRVFGRDDFQSLMTRNVVQTIIGGRDYRCRGRRLGRLEQCPLRRMLFLLLPILVAVATDDSEDGRSTQHRPEHSRTRDKCRSETPFLVGFVYLPRLRQDDLFIRRILFRNQKVGTGESKAVEDTVRIWVVPLIRVAFPHVWQRRHRRLVEKSPAPPDPKFACGRTQAKTCNHKLPVMK
jgi:hypothetical protein